MLTKRGLSGVVTTLLILLITIVGVSMIAAVLIPWVQSTLNNQKGCFNLKGELSFNEAKSCYNVSSTSGLNSTKINIVFGKLNLSEMSLWLETNDDYKMYRIKKGSSCCSSDVPPIKIITTTGSETLNLGKPGSEIYYIINNTIVKKAKVAPVINGKDCAEAAEEIVLERCDS